LLVGEVTGVQVSDIAAVLALAGELADPGGDGRADGGCGGARPGAGTAVTRRGGGVFWLAMVSPG
jgi:hypothetical protein